MTKQKHLFHLVDYSPWPLLTSLGNFLCALNAVAYINQISNGIDLLFSLIFTIGTMSIWWRDVIREGTFQGHHTTKVQKGLKLGMILFIISEVMFFFAFFWAFFHSSLAPAIEIGSIWPPRELEVFNPWEVPLLNTLILLFSGASVTWAHHALLLENRGEFLKALILTIVLAVIFTMIQGYEYVEAAFRISDGIYGSTFYMATGFHGFHVIVGTIFLSVCLVRGYYFHFTRTHHVGFEAAAWYWHFVDVVWLFLFVSVYWWGNYSVSIFDYYMLTGVLLNIS